MRRHQGNTIGMSVECKSSLFPDLIQIHLPGFFKIENPQSCSAEKFKSRVIAHWLHARLRCTQPWVALTIAARSPCVAEACTWAQRDVRFASPNAAWVRFSARRDAEICMQISRGGIVLLLRQPTSACQMRLEWTRNEMNQQLSPRRARVSHAE